MGLLSKIFNNTRKPEGFFGRLMVAGMNGGSHAAMATWGLEKASIPQTGDILDIGCGGGANIARLLARSKEARVIGVDYSPVSVAKASKVNANAIAQGRCEVREQREMGEDHRRDAHLYARRTEDTSDCGRFPERDHPSG